MASLGTKKSGRGMKRGAGKKRSVIRLEKGEFSDTEWAVHETEYQGGRMVYDRVVDYDSSKKKVQPVADRLRRERRNAKARSKKKKAKAKKKPAKKKGSKRKPAKKKAKKKRGK